MLYVRLPSREIYFFTALLFAPTAGEPEISTVSKSFDIVSNKFFADSDFQV